MAFAEQFSDWNAKFAKVDDACRVFLHERNKHLPSGDSRRWSVVMYRWDNPDRLLSGNVKDGVSGNIHILLVPEDSRFRFTYATWRDKDGGVDHGYRRSMRLWSTSDDYTGDQYLSLNEATVATVKPMLDKAWDALLQLSTLAKARQETILQPL